MLSIISGVTGQTGSYLAENLLDKGERVIGFSRRTAVHSTWRIDHLLRHSSFTYMEGDLTDQQFIWKLIADHKPDKFFNLAAQSHVHTSFTNPGSTFYIDFNGVLNILEAIRTLSPETRMYQASTSEMFGSNFTQKSLVDNIRVNKLKNILKAGGPLGKMDIVWGPEASFESGDVPDTHNIRLISGLHERFQNENTPFSPNSPYAIAKLAAHNLVRLYRESYGLKCCSGILFNHESPRRGDNFVTQKIIKWIVGFKKWYNPLFESGRFFEQDSQNRLYNSLCDKDGFPKLRLGNLDASRDWGHAKDYAEAIDLILSAPKQDDYVVATGETHTIREFLDEAFGLIGITNWSDCVVIDPKFVRPCEVPFLCGKADKIKKELGWSPKTTFKELVKDMYEAELSRSTI